MNSQRVRAGHRETLCVHPPGAKHIISADQEFIVKKYVRVGVQPFKDQLQVRSLEHLRREVNGGLIFPIGLAYPLQLLFVVAIKRIIDQLVFEQVSMYATGNARRVPLVFAGLTELPPRLDGYFYPTPGYLSSSSCLRERSPGSQNQHSQNW